MIKQDKQPTMSSFSLVTHHAPSSLSRPRSLVVLLHGYGADGNDLLGLVTFWQRHFPDTLFVSPDAPHPHEGGMGRQWFSLTQGLEPSAIVSLLTASAPLVNQYLDELLTYYELNASDLIVSGFSQGGMLALHVGLRRASPVAGIMSFSSILAEPPPPMPHYPPVLLTHGSDDPLIAYTHMHDAESQLKASGVAVASLLEHGLGHGINDAIIVRAQQFMKQCLSSAH